MAALRTLLAVVALLASTGCSTLGLALAEDVTRIGGALTNQEATANRLADQLAALRGAQEAAERSLLDRALALERASDKTQATIEAIEEDAAREIPAPVTGGAAAALALLLDYLNNRRRDAKHDQREVELAKRLTGRGAGRGEPA